MSFNAPDYLSHLELIDTAIKLGYVSIFLGGISMMLGIYEASACLEERERRREQSKLETKLQSPLER